ncbi:hypothetical protein [Pendulispora rubella]
MAHGNVEGESFQKGGNPVSEGRESTERISVDDFSLTIERKEEGSIIRLSDATGREPLRIALGPDGPVLFLGSGLSIAVAGDLSFAANRIAMHAKDGVAISTGGDATIRCEGDLVTDAREQRIHARLGEVRVEANDDVRLLGERIKLNC